MDEAVIGTKALCHTHNHFLVYSHLSLVCLHHTARFAHKPRCAHQLTCFFITCSQAYEMVQNFMSDFQHVLNHSELRCDSRPFRRHERGKADIGGRVMISRGWWFQERGASNLGNKRKRYVIDYLQKGMDSLNRTPTYHHIISCHIITTSRWQKVRCIQAV